MEGLSLQTLTRDEICLFRCLSVLLEGERQYSSLMLKAVLSQGVINVSQTEGSGEFCKVTEKSRLLG
jgi:hypothetical protein